MQADLLNGIGYVRPGERQVLKGTSQTAISRGISNRRVRFCRNFSTSINGGGARIAVAHAMAAKDVQDVLPLREEHGVLVALNSHAKKEMEGTKVLHGKFLLAGFNNTVKKLWRGGSEHNVVHVEEQVNCVSASAKDE
jgi:hypothetical protein